MKPKVLFTDHAGVLGGAELSLLDIAAHFAASSAVLLFADGPFRGRLEQAGVQVRLVHAPQAVSGVSKQGRLGRDLRAVGGVLKLAWSVARQARAFDVLYANSQKSLVISAVAGQIARRPVIWHLRDMLARTSDFSSAHLRLVITLANRFTARVIANSQATAAAFVQSGGRTERIRVVYNGIDAAAFDAAPREESAALRQTLGLGDQPVVGVFSRLAPWKGQHILLEALPTLPGVHALLVGEALFGEDAYAERLQQQARTLNIAERVHFLGFCCNIPALMRLVDVVVHTSTSPEPFGRVLVEGMLARRPVVATRAGAAVEIIDDRRTGRLTPPGDAAALAAVLQELLDDRAEAAALATRGRATAEQRFSLPALLSGVEEQIAEVLGSAS